MHAFGCPSASAILYVAKNHVEQMQLIILERAVQGCQPALLGYRLTVPFQS